MFWIDFYCIIHLPYRQNAFQFGKMKVWFQTLTSQVPQHFVLMVSVLFFWFVLLVTPFSSFWEGMNQLLENQVELIILSISWKLCLGRHYLPFLFGGAILCQISGKHTNININCNWFLSENKLTIWNAKTAENPFWMLQMY